MLTGWQRASRGGGLRALLIVVVGALLLGCRASSKLQGNASQVAQVADKKTAAVSTVAGNNRVTIEKRGEAFVLLRNGEPYTIRGVGGRQRLDEAARSGANSVRTWGGEDAPAVFEQAERLGLTVFVGIWLSHDANDYESEVYKASKRTEVIQLVERYKDHPQLLVWALGNEIQLGADIPIAWQFVEELAQLVKARDPHHPIATVTAHAPTEVLDHIAQHAPSVTLLGVNSYAGLPVVPRDMEPSAFKGPFVITEWGPDGHWETANTSWGRPIEQSSAQKALVYAERLRLIESWTERCLGSYVFLWGQKQERTSTWYGLFMEDRPELGLRGQTTPQLDAVASGWTDRPPATLAPVVNGLLLNDKKPEDSVVLKPGEQAHAQGLVGQVEAARGPVAADGTALRFAWELLEEPTKLGQGGAYEERPPRAATALHPDGAKVSFTAPPPGEYRLFFYALDTHHKVGTANFPFKVR